MKSQHTLVAEAAKKLIKLARRRDYGTPVVSAKLSAMSPATISYVHTAITNTTSDKLADAICSFIAMEAEDVTLLYSRYWKIYETPMTNGVNESMVFRFLRAPLESNPSDEEMAPYVTKAQAICAVAETFWVTTGNVNRVRDLCESYPEYMELFLANPGRATELAQLMVYRKATSISDLKERLDLHPAIVDGAL